LKEVSQEKPACLKNSYFHVSELWVVGWNCENDIFDVEMFIHDFKARKGYVDEVSWIHKNTLINESIY
jgi:hypothetical protein